MLNYSDNIEFKIALIGEPEVGISSLIKLATGKSFEDEPDLTKKYYKETIVYNNHSYTYILWEPFGMQRHRPFTKLFIKNARIVLIIFAINNKKSFEEVDYWYKYIKDTMGTDEKCIIALVGNKSDLHDEQEVSNEEIEKKANELNIKYKIISAKTGGERFKIFFNELLEEYINKYLSEKIKTSTFKIEANKKNIKNKNKCNN